MSISAIRLQWWVEAIEKRSGDSVPLMDRLLCHLDRGSLASADLVAQMGHWQDRLSRLPEDAPDAIGDCWADCFGKLLPSQEQAASQVGRALVDADARIGDEALGLLATAEGRWVWMIVDHPYPCLLYTSPSPRDGLLSRMPSSA